MLPRLLYLKDFQIKWQLKTSYCLKGIEDGCASLHSYTKDIGQFMLSAKAKSRFVWLLFKFKLKIGFITVWNLLISRRPMHMKYPWKCTVSKIKSRFMYVI